MNHRTHGRGVSKVVVLEVGGREYGVGAAVLQV